MANTLRPEAGEMTECCFRDPVWAVLAALLMLAGVCGFACSDTKTRISAKDEEARKRGFSVSDAALDSLVEKAAEKVFSDVKTAPRLDGKCPVYLDADRGTYTLRFKALLEEKLRPHPEIALSRMAQAGEPVAVGGGAHVHRSTPSLMPEPTPLLEVRIWEAGGRLHAAVSPWAYRRTPEENKANASSCWTQSIEIGSSAKQY
jgi:hypothetical protein